MKKLVLVLAAAILTAGMMSAQDLQSVTETYNNGAEALNIGDKSSALGYFKQALADGLAVGADADDVVANCKKIIPTVILSMGKEEYNAKNFEAALVKITEALEAAKEYGNEEVVAEAEGLVPQVSFQKEFTAAKAALDAKKVDEAIEGFKKALEIKGDDANSALLLGQALGAKGDLAGAEEAFAIASANGKEAVANKQLSNLYLKQAAALLKGGKNADAMESAKKANSFLENAQAYLIEGQAASKLNKDSVAIAAFEKFLELSPNAKNANAITFTVGALYQKAGNKAKAIEAYTKVLSDPQFGVQAKQMIDALNK